MKLKRLVNSQDATSYSVMINRMSCGNHKSTRASSMEPLLTQSVGQDPLRWVTRQFPVGCVAPSSAIIEHMGRWDIEKGTDCVVILLQSRL